MNLARQINQKLDEMLEIRDQLKKLRAQRRQGLVVNNIETGKPVSDEEIINRVTELKQELITELNQITNNGSNAKDIFTNKYYINDTMQDKELKKD
jgi:hypothetical protein